MRQIFEGVLRHGEKFNDEWGQKTRTDSVQQL